MKSSQIACKVPLERFKRKVLNPVKYDGNGRLYSAISNFPKVLLPALSYDGLPLMELDMSNAQFTLLAHALCNQSLDNPISQYANKIKFDTTSTDFKKFSDLAASGKLYEEVRDNFDLQDRDTAKEFLFTMIFGLPKHNTSDAPIHSLFSSVNDFARRFKLYTGDYKSFANALQRIESDLFIRHILKQLHSLNLPVATKHDALLFPSSFFNIFYYNLIKELNRVLA